MNLQTYFVLGAQVLMTVGSLRELEQQVRSRNRDAAGSPNNCPLWRWAAR